ncbi:hypothetical protein MPSI1_003519 [Malassezia psittaci]|uniref:Major facilitator superfamily (MFS) profile domain-containing protein n=1 Tax=Malassezia psittaci TaxID=1821823 RepID=A0AAF0JFL1_9BASI|nr:hypothetical protein MPSI1_003519 [Malassezia psittaci]
MPLTRQRKDPFNGLFRIPDAEERVRLRAGAPLNPFKIIAMLSPLQWAWFLCGMFCWIMDAYDFFSVSMNVTKLATKFYNLGPNDDSGPAVTKINYSIMLTLLFRSLGALIFGLLSDRFGRRWPLVANMLVVGALSLGTAYADTMSKFLGVRAIFGIGMGGIWGMAAATALENMPTAARGLFSGIFQQGYAVGYLIAAAVNLGWASKYHHGEGRWEIMFYLGAGLSLAAAVFRAILPESPKFVEQDRLRKLQSDKEAAVKHFLVETGEMLKEHWAQCIYAIILMTCVGFFSHSSQDLYPTMLQKAKLLSASQASLATIISNCGAISGGILAGYVSQYIGRRLAMLGAVIFAGCFIPLWIIPDTFSGLAAGGFFVQVGVQGLLGIIPVYLNEISPPAFRATFPGLSYQLGNLGASASSTIESRGGQSLRMPNPKKPGQTMPNYAKVSAILFGVDAFALVLLMLFGFEKRGNEMGVKVHVTNLTEEQIHSCEQGGCDIETCYHGNPNEAYIHDPKEYERTHEVHLNRDSSSDKKIAN